MDPTKDTEFVIDDGRIESLEEYLSPEVLYEDLICRVKKYHPSDDISIIARAYRIADEAHQGQVIVDEFEAVSVSMKVKD